MYNNNNNYRQQRSETNYEFNPEFESEFENENFENEFNNESENEYELNPGFNMEQNYDSPNNFEDEITVHDHRTGARNKVSLRWIAKQP